MKTIRTILFVAFAAMTLAACVKELDTQNGEKQKPGKMVTFTATLGSLNTKTMIHYEREVNSGEFTTRFLNGDHLLLNGVESGDINKENSTGSQITFQVPDVEAPYYAVTKKQSRGYDPETNKYSILVSGTGAPQEYYRVSSGTQTTFDPDSDILAAYSDNETLQFKHMCTFIAITIDKENSTVQDNIKNIYIRQGDGDFIAGTWHLTFDENNEPVMEPSNLGAFISYECVTKNFSPAGVEQGKVMIVAVPAYEYKTGLIVTIKDVNGKFASYKIPATQADFSKKGGYIIPFNPEFNPQSRTIKSADDWNEFATCVNTAKNDWDIYTWIGDGTIKLEDDIDGDSLIPITKPFPYVFDGNKKTITINNATKPLFDTVTGEIKDLTIAGTLGLSASGAPLVNTLKAGGKVTGCTNKMSVTANIKGHTYVSGLVSVMEGGEIKECINEGTLDVTVDVHENIYEVAVAGLVADVRVSDETSSLLFKDCINKAALTLYPKLAFQSAQGTSNKGMQVCGFGGIAGWVRNAATYTFNNCDNEGPITLNASKITHKYGNCPRTISVGGILGLAAPCPDGLMIDPGSESYPSKYAITLQDCDNSALIYNAGVNYSSRGEVNNKVFTGGVAGALAGISKTYAEVKSCTNTGNIITHDYVTNQAEVTPSVRPNFCSVAGGLIGYAGYLNINDCDVTCQIGNGRRQMAAWGGVLGYTLRPFTFTNSDVKVTGYFASYSGYDDNCAAVAIVPVNDGGDKTSNISPNVSGSKISNNTITCQINTHYLGTSTGTTGAQKTDDLSTSEWVTKFKTEDDIIANLVCGENYITAADDINAEGNTCQIAASAN